MIRLGRLQANWVYGGFLAGLMLLALTPLLLGGWDRAAVLAFLALPVYMLHQYEEHDDDRFHRFVVVHLGHGRDVLPTPAIFLINIGVTGVIFFVPLGVAILATSPAGLGLHLFGLALIIGLHAAIVVSARSKLGSAPLYTSNLANGG